MKTKKLLGSVLALMLVLSMVPTALAAPANAVEDPAGRAWLTKTYNAAVGKAFTFQFSAVQDTTTEGYIKDAVACTIPDIAFLETDVGTTKKRVELGFADFTKAGVYRYVVKESGVTPAWTDTVHEKLILSKAEYEVLVYVEQFGAGVDVGIDSGWDTNHDMGLESLTPETGLRAASADPADYKVVKIIVNSLLDDAGVEVPGKPKVDSGDGDGNTFNFENTYVVEGGSGPDPEDPEYPTQGSLDISKQLLKDGKAPGSGSTALNKAFSFAATFTFPAGTDTTTLGGVTANGTSITLTSGTPYTFTLTHGKNMVFKKLPAGTIVTVVETGVPNFKGSAVSTMNEGTPANFSAAYGENLTINDQTLGVKTNTVAVTNTWITTPPTGVIINALPYVLMLAIAGGALFLFVFLKRKRNQYEEN